MTLWHYLHPAPVDIVMATYNGAAYIKEQIDSILSQEYPSLRLIISDDGSSDGTREILEAYAQKHPSVIRLLPYGQNLGVRCNFSRLLESATADYIFLSDQDDVWDRDKVPKSLKKLRELEAVHGKETPLLVHTDLRVVDKTLSLISPSFWKFCGLDPIAGKTLNRLLMQNVVTGCTTVINRPLLKLALPIPGYCDMHDWWLSLVGAAFGRVEPVPSATISYRQHGSNTVGAKEYMTFQYIIEGLNRLGTQSAGRRMQAKELLRRYELQLTDDQKIAISTFINLPQCSIVKKGYMIIKHGFFRSGLMRNLASLIERGSS